MQPKTDGPGLSAEEIVSRMSTREKIGLMTPKSSLVELIWQAVVLKHYNKTPVRAGGNKRFDIPEIRFCDGPRGLVCANATCFPVSIARAASFDIELEERIGRAISAEIRSVGGNFYGGVCVNVPRHPAWGRSQESYGEDPFLAGAFGSALVRGIRYHNVIACVKHFALNSMENARFKVDVTCTERTLREVYLPHFKKCVEAGAKCVMGAYNKFRGEYCCHNSYLLRDILKGDWGFTGFTMSDFIWGIRDTVKAVTGGMDVEMPLSRFYGRKLRKAVSCGAVDIRHIDDAARRITETMLEAKRAEDPRGEYPRTLLACKKHVLLAATAAERSMTLLKNEHQTLPFELDGVKNLAVFGRLAEAENLGDHGSSRVYPPYTITPLQGLRNLFGEEGKITYAGGDNLNECRRIAERADAAVIFAGYNHIDEGEYISLKPGKDGGDRESLSLRAEDIDLIKAVAPCNRKAVVVLIGGGPILVDEWDDDVPAILMAYYPGMEGGNVIARTLTGMVNPGGKLPFVIPKRPDDLPAFDRDADEAFYEYYRGYTIFDSMDVVPSYHFGYGLSYSSFDISNVIFSASPRGVKACCSVANTSGRSGDEVVQLYIGFENSSVERPVKLLRDFRRISLLPGEKKDVELFCCVDDLRWYNPDTREWEVEKMEYQAYIGTSADPSRLERGVFNL